MRLTLRTRATLLATALTAAVLVVASVALVLVLRDQLTDGTDALSRQRVADLLAQAERDDLPARITNLDDEGMAQVVTDDGQVLAASANLADAPPVSDWRPDGPTVRTLRAPDDDETETYRVWAASIDTPDGRVTAYVGDSLESVHEATSTLRTSLYVGVPLLLLALALGTWAVLGGALRRVDRIRADADTITADRLDRRLPADGPDDEVGRLAITLNRMLARLEEARTRQQEFVADVSHDLQSPLAAQRTQLEVARAHPGDTDLDALTRALLDTTADMERLVRDLLVLAAADADAPTAEHAATDVDLDDVVLEEVARARDGSVLTFDTSGVSAAPARADRTDLVRVVRNLLDNAVAHAATTITLTASTGPGGTRLVVDDDGTGVPPDERERVFDRFHRLDASRSRHSHGSGLGLPIARALAERHGGTLVIDDAGRFVLTLPPVP